MEKFNVTGMSCAACVARVESAVRGVRGVTECSVSLLTSSMTVEGTASSQDIISAVYKAGYGATPWVNGENDSLKDKETPKIKKRLFLSLGFLLLLMYLSMGYTMWGFPLPAFLSSKPSVIGVLQLALSGALLVINRKFFVNGVGGLIKGAPNMDTLVALGSGVSYIYSLILLFSQWGSPHILHSLYFESAGMILVLITVGKLLEAISKGKTTNALRELVSLQPKSATVLINGEERQIPASELKPKDVFVVRAGGVIPADGVVTEGQGAVNESMLTGESLPVDKAVGDKVYAGTINTFGYIRCSATSLGEDTVLGEIIKTVSDSASSKAPIARVADRVSGVFVPIVMGIALITFAIWKICGADLGYALSRGISVLVISCPCSLGLATPVAIMVSNGVGARHGILFKNATALEHTGRAKTVVLDKTGTITKGMPVVTDIISASVTENELLSLAYSLEEKSEHPLAGAIVREAQKRGAELYKATDFATLFGSGVSCKIEGHTIVGGSFKHISTIVPSLEYDTFSTLSAEGKTPLYFARDGILLGIIAVRDEIKEDSREAIERLRQMGLNTVMLTGDNERSAKAIARAVSVSTVIAEVMPNDKADAVKTLQGTGAVIMVGDGINDSPALATADVGIAIGTGTEIAIDSADIVLMSNRLTDVARATRLSRATLKNIYENLFWAFIYNIVGIPIATGVFAPLWGWELSPMLGALAMSLSSICVVTNALRLNFINLDKENKKMFGKKIEGVTIGVEGMMCPHCEARVKKVVEEIPGVTEAIPSHKKKQVVVLGECDIEAVKAVIKAEGYSIKD